MTKRKDERRELLKEDELLSGMEKVAKYIQENPNKVLTWTVVVLVGMALLFGSQAYMKSQKVAAAGSLYQAEKILNTDITDEKAELKFDSEKAKYEAALAEVEKVLESASGVPRYQALLVKANCLSTLGRSDECLSIYEELASSGGKMKVFGVKGQADYYFVKKDYAKAIGFYEELKKLDNVSNALADYRIAECHKESGDEAKAREVLNALVDKYKDAEAEERPPIHFKAEQMLTELKADDSNEG